MSEYEKYQLRWMLAHGHSLRDLINELTELQCGDPEDSDQISTPCGRLVRPVGAGLRLWVRNLSVRGRVGGHRGQGAEGRLPSN